MNVKEEMGLLLSGADVHIQLLIFDSVRVMGWGKELGIGEEHFM